MDESEMRDSVKADILGAAGWPDSVASLWSTSVPPDASPADTIKDAHALSFTMPDITPKIIAYPGDDAESADYAVVGKLGEGGMGIVFEAEQRHLRQRVALKMIKADKANDPLARNSFFYEAVVTAGLEHPGIIPVLEFGVSQDARAFYAMKKASGVPWHRVMREKTCAENLDILNRVAEVMAYAHAQGVIHRDLKPANILLGEFGEVWVGDWGVALRCNTAGDYTHAHPGGTPQYMPPELAKCDSVSIGPRSDVYLLGAILFEIVTGRPPHDGNTVLSALDAAAANTVSSTDGTDGLFAVAYKAMAQSPEGRYHTANEFREAIRKSVALDMNRQLLADAGTLLQKARETDDYDTFRKSITLYDAALVEHPDDTEAGKGRLEALLAYARSAFSKSEYDLALSLLSPLATHDNRVAELTDAIKRRQAEIARRRKRRRFAVATMIGILLIGVAVTTILYQRMQKQVASMNRDIERHDAVRAQQVRWSRLVGLNMYLPGGAMFIAADIDEPLPREPSSFKRKNETSEEREMRERRLTEYEEKYRVAKLRNANRDEMLARIEKLLEPVKAMVHERESYTTGSDKAMTELYQLLKSLRPQMREEIETATRLAANGELNQRVAENIIDNLTYLSDLPDSNALPGINDW